VYAASDSAPRQTREIELCERASSTDWVYMSGLVAGVVGTVALDEQVDNDVGREFGQSGLEHGDRPTQIVLGDVDVDQRVHPFVERPHRTRRRR
jgi:hypothetical protein